MPSPILPTGKLPAEFLTDLLASDAPLPPDVLLGPAVGEDAAAIRVPGGTLIAATDPITFTGDGIGRYAVIINANDVAVTGVAPRWFLCTALLPPGTTEAAVRTLFAEIRDELAVLDAALVGGHTEVTPAVTQPVIVGQFLGLSPDGSFVRTGGLSPGDRVVQVGSAPIEGAAVLAAECADLLTALPEQTLAAATTAVREPGISVVQSALAATALNATSLHDPTEGGVATGLIELAQASEVGMEIDAAALFGTAATPCPSSAAPSRAPASRPPMAARYQASNQMKLPACSTNSGANRARRRNLSRPHLVPARRSPAGLMPPAEQVPKKSSEKL